MQLETAPRLYLLPPTEVGGPKMKMSDFEIQVRSQVGDPSALLEEIERLSGIKVK